MLLGTVKRVLQKGKKSITYIMKKIVDCPLLWYHKCGLEYTDRFLSCDNSFEATLFKVIRNKLQSNKGASLILALFLFLICAAVGAVVLTSGTVAAGRLADINEADQRYYAVTSAADAITDMIDGHWAKVKTVTVSTTTYASNSQSTYSSDPEYTISEGIVVDNNDHNTTTITSSFTSFIMEAAFKSTLGQPVVHSYELKVDSKSGLDAELDESVAIDGTMVFVVRNSNSSNRKYLLQLTFVPTKEYDSDSTVVTVRLDDGTIEETLTRTDITKYTWKLEDIKTVGL